MESKTSNKEITGLILTASGMTGVVFGIFSAANIAKAESVMLLYAGFLSLLFWPGVVVLNIGIFLYLKSKMMNIAQNFYNKIVEMVIGFGLLGLTYIELYRFIEYGGFAVFDWFGKWYVILALVPAAIMVAGGTILLVSQYFNSQSVSK